MMGIVFDSFFSLFFSYPRANAEEGFSYCATLLLDPALRQKQGLHYDGSQTTSNQRLRNELNTIWFQYFIDLSQTNTLSRA